MITKINTYIAKKFLVNFALVLVSVSLLIAMINIFELLNKVAGKDVSFGDVFLLDVLQVPGFIEDIAIFLIMIASMITLFSLSVRSEITVMRSSGLSFWQILLPIAAASFFLGLFFILIFNPLSIAASKKFILLEQKLVSEEVNILSPINGIWLKQENLLDSREDIIIRADRIYRKSLKMVNVNLWFFNKDHKYYKRLDAKYMTFSDGAWHLENVRG